MNKQELTQQIKRKANELGFALVGVTSPEPPAHTNVFEGWLRAGRHGDMEYLATKRSVHRRADPKHIRPECKSILVLGTPYSNPTRAEKPSDDKAYGRIASYAWGEDYHEVIKPRLALLVAYIEELVGREVSNRWYTDTGPILERELAQRAGLGWIGKNTMLINPERGSYFLLAEILLSIELEFDAAITTDHCGTCTRCIEACPTQCILPDRTLDATQCISYLTIESKGPIGAELRAKMGDWIFGCDVCQTVCPWNERFADERGDAAFAIEHQWVELETELQLKTRDFNAKFKRSPIQHTKRRGYLRNVAVALGNAKKPSSIAALQSSLSNETEPLARGHAAWALGQIGGRAASDALREAAKVERDDWVREEIEAALSRING